MNNKAIYLFRHGETEWNAERRWQGQLDSPLSEKGRNQAVQHARKLENIIADKSKVAVFCSPLGRARETAEIMLDGLGISTERVSYDPLLMEVGFGAWEGLTVDEIMAEFPDEWNARRADLWNTPAPGGESYADVHRRVTDWYRGTDFAEETIVVCHSITSRVFRAHYAGLDNEAVSDMDDPQDGFYELRNGAVRFVG